MRVYRYMLGALFFFPLVVWGLTASVAIPCYYKHFPYLTDLLQHLAHQTQVPEEVVIALSQVEELDSSLIDELEGYSWPFHLLVLRREGVFMEGANRTLAASTASQEIVLCIDADDIPHPQRVEAVCAFFDRVQEADFVLTGHAYCPGNSIICEPAIPFFTAEGYRELRFDLIEPYWTPLYTRQDLMRWDSGVHNGSPSFRRGLLDADLFWTDRKNGADLEFNTKVLERGVKGFLLTFPLIHYYNQRSSGSDIGRESV